MPIDTNPYITISTAKWFCRIFFVVTVIAMLSGNDNYPAGYIAVGAVFLSNLLLKHNLGTVNEDTFHRSTFFLLVIGLTMITGVMFDF